MQKLSSTKKETMRHWTVKTTAWLGLVLLSSLFLTGCSHQRTGEFGDVSNINSITPTATKPNASPAASNKTNLPLINSEKGTMKTLADFQPITGSTVTLTTSKGDITLTLFRDQAPLTTLNFLTLLKQGFYDGIVFHRVIADFMAQAGDPLSKDPTQQARWGSGDPGYTIADEFGAGLKHDSAGILSMANRGPNTGGSQFFITFEPTPWLDGKHAIFGKVSQGLDVLNQIQVGDKIISAKISE